jgi:hypothetical protein
LDVYRQAHQLQPLSQLFIGELGRGELQLDAVQHGPGGQGIAELQAGADPPPGSRQAVQAPQPMLAVGQRGGIPLRFFLEQQAAEPVQLPQARGQLQLDAVARALRLAGRLQRAHLLGIEPMPFDRRPERLAPQLLRAGRQRLGLLRLGEGPVVEQGMEARPREVRGIAQQLRLDRFPVLGRRALDQGEHRRLVAPVQQRPILLVRFQVARRQAVEELLLHWTVAGRG